MLNYFGYIELNKQFKNWREEEEKKGRGKQGTMVEDSGSSGGRRTMMTAAEGDIQSCGKINKNIK